MGTQKRKGGKKDEEERGKRREKWICRGEKKRSRTAGEWPCLRRPVGAPAMQLKGSGSHVALPSAHGKAGSAQRNPRRELGDAKLLPFSLFLTCPYGCAGISRSPSTVPRWKAQPRLLPGAHPKKAREQGGARCGEKPSWDTADPHHFTVYRRPGGKGRAQQQECAAPSSSLQNGGTALLPSAGPCVTPTKSRLRCFSHPFKQSAIRVSLALCNVFVTGPVPL